MRSWYVPTGLAYIATALRRAGHAVRVHIREVELIKNGFDWVAADAHLRHLLEEFRPEMVGLSVLTPSVPESAALSRLAKEILGEHVLVAAGGAHPTALPERMLHDCPDVDAVVVGEGEATMAELAEKGPGPDVAGLVVRREGSFLRTARRPLQTDLDRLGPPAYDLFDMKFHTQPSPWLIRWLKVPALNVRTSRGCPNRCRFCAGHVVSGLGVRYHSIEYVLDQVSYAVERFGVKAIHFEDDTLGADPSRLLDLCEAMRRCDLHRRVCWDCCLRVDQAEPGLLAQMKSAGCIQVEYGFESGSDEALRRLGKNATVEMNRRAVQLTREAGLRVFADIMVGLPGETEAEVEATLRFLRWARPEVISAGRLCPLPGTPIYEELPPEVRDSLDWPDYTYLDHPIYKINLTAMSDERFERVYRELDKYFARPLTTWHRLRDTPREDRAERRRLVRKLLRFILQHPLRAARLPW